MKQVLCLFYLLFFIPCLVNAQSGFFDEPIFKVSVFTHSIGIPFKDYVKKPLNLGISIGAQFVFDKEKQNPWMQELELSWFNHRHLNKSLMIKTNLSKNYFSDSGLFAAPEIGFGYIMDFSENASYKLNEGGRYEKAAGISHGFTSQISFTAGKRFQKEGKNAYAPFIKYEGMIQFPYSDFTPFLPHTMIHIGSKIFVTENK